LAESPGEAEAVTTTTRGLRGDLPHALGRLEPVEDGHVEIHEHDVRPEQGGEVDRLLAVVRVAGDLQTVVGLKRDRQRFGEQRVVVDDQDPEWASWRSFLG